jgi:MSHA pilin protein MshD
MHGLRTHGKRFRLSGFTLIEVVISALIVTLMLVAALETVGASARARLIQREMTQGATLARHLLSEIMQCRYADPDTESGEMRATWDDVSDYDNLTESPPASRSGTPLGGYTGWQRTVQVKWANPNNPGSDAAADSGLKRITVTVTSPSGRKTTLTGLRSKNGVYERKPGAQTTYVSWAGLVLQVGADPGTAAVSGVNLLNQVP